MGRGGEQESGGASRKKKLGVPLEMENPSRNGNSLLFPTARRGQADSQACGPFIAAEHRGTSPEDRWSCLKNNLCSAGEGRLCGEAEPPGI